MLRVRKYFVSAMAVLLVAPLSAIALLPTTNAGASPASTKVVVDGNNQFGWNVSQTCYSEDYSTTIPIDQSDKVTFVTGPSAPPLGVGSLQLATGNGVSGATCSAALRNSNYDDVPLSSLTTLSYSTYDQENSPNDQQFPFLVLHINYGEGGENADDTLFFEPPYQTPGAGNVACPDQGPTVMDEWQTWDALDGCWWSNSGLLGKGGEGGVEPLSALLAEYPNAYIVNSTDDLSTFAPTTQGGIGVEVGETGDPDQFIGNVDDLTIGITPQYQSQASTTTYDFEPVPATTSTPTLTWASPTAITSGTALGSAQLDAQATYESATVPGTYSYSPSFGTVLSTGLHTLKVTFTPTSLAYSSASTSTTIYVNPASTTSQVIYDSTTTPNPPNLVSEAYEATQTSELGNQITFAPGTSRILSQATITLSSWGCQSGGWTNGCVTTPGSTFQEPITLNIYNVNPDNSVGSLITSVTQTFNIPYRPSSDPADCLLNQTQWYSSATGECYNGLATNVTFNIPSVVVPSTIIYGIAYNTSDYGSPPDGDSTDCHATPEGCGYDSLNVGLTIADQPSIGSDPLPGTVYQNTDYAPYFCDGGLAGTGTFRLDSPNSAPCWGANPPYTIQPWYIPSAQFVATTAAPTITWANPTSITYGTKLSATQLDATATYKSAPVAGSFSYTPGIGTVLSAGTHTLSETFTPTNSSYSQVTTTVSITVNPAVLTVKATNTSRAFGAANPTFAYTISGFVNSDPASVVHGTPTCTTTATATSEGGTYPITCNVSALSATNYTFTPIAGTLTVNYTTGCLSGTYNGYTVPNGASVCFGSGATVNSYLNVGTGSSLDIEGAKVNGPITSVKSNVVRICAATVSGPVTLTYDTGAVVIGDGASCAGSKVTNALTLTGDTGGSSVIGATVTGPLTLSGDTGGETLNSNNVANALTVQSSSGGLTANSNTVSGPFTLESNSGGVTADSNNSTGSFTIQSNTGGITILTNSTKGNFTVESNSGSQSVSGNTAKGPIYIH